MAGRSEFIFRSFKDVVHHCRKKHPNPSGQSELRNYSEMFSAGVADWLSSYFTGPDFETVHTGEHGVPVHNGKKKKLDIACFDNAGRLSLDISIKTFNFRDQRSGNYKKNYTGRFYELLGESMCIHKAYPDLVMAAIIFLPLDGCVDQTKGAPSSFGSLVRQFSEIAGRTSANGDFINFEFVYVALHNPGGDVYFFDTTRSPPWSGEPEISERLSVEHVCSQLSVAVKGRRSLRKKLTDRNLGTDFRWSDRT